MSKRNQGQQESAGGRSTGEDCEPLTSATSADIRRVEIQGVQGDARASTGADMMPSDEPIAVVRMAGGEGTSPGQTVQSPAPSQTHPELGLLDVGWSLATTRTAFEHRAVILGGDRDELLDGLGKLAAGDPAAQVITGTRWGRCAGRCSSSPGRVRSGTAWRPASGPSPVFAAQIHACQQALAPYVDWSLHDVLRQAGSAPSLERVDVVQPVLFAVMAGLARMWQACGVQPDAVIGHSQGEITAAYIAGACPCPTPQQ